MNSDGVVSGAQIHQLRVYLLAIVVYIGIASLFVVPIVNKNRIDNAVQTQLSQYLKQKPENRSSSAPSVSGKPSTISIERLGISLPVAPGYYSLATQKWTLDSTHVFTDNYTNPNPTVGNHQSRVTVFYGHDIPGILIKTSQLTYGDIMTINTQNGYQFRYYYDKSEVLSPTDTSILNEKNTGSPVVLVTCTGAWYQYRHAMYFHLLDIKKTAAQGQVNV